MNLKKKYIFITLYLLKANRVTTMHDFGYVALNMKYVNPEDSGTYTCRATNELGEAVTSATLFVQCKSKLNAQFRYTMIFFCIICKLIYGI